MGILNFLTTEDGQVITTESGEGILVSEIISNGDIQFFNFSVNVLQALLWQYNNATNLQSILQQKQDWYNKNQSAFWENWIQNVFNLETANDFGLAVWSIILGQPTFISNQPSPIDYPAWGFGPNRKNFNNGNFGSNHGNTYQLSTNIARILLQLRYYQLISSGTVPETNRMLKKVFASYGPAFLVDNLNMTQKYVFLFTLPADLKLMLDNFDVLPRPAGVRTSYIEGNVASFGFGAYHANFGNGNFFGG